MLQWLQPPAITPVAVPAPQGTSREGVRTPFFGLLCRLSKLPGRVTQNSGSHSSGAKDRVRDSTILHQGLGCSFAAQGSPNHVLLPFPSHLVAHLVPRFPGTPPFPQIPCLAPPTPAARAPLSQWLCQSHSWALLPSFCSPDGVNSWGWYAVQCHACPGQQVKGASPPCSLLDLSQHPTGPKWLKRQPKPLCWVGGSRHQPQLLLANSVFPSTSWWRL